MTVSRRARGRSLWFAGAAAACLLTVSYSAAASAGVAGVAGVTSQAPAGPSLLSVACSGARTCVAVGTDAAKEPISQVWNGTSWKYAAVPARGQALNGVACPTAADCLAVGNLGVADQWNGKSWRLTRTPFGTRLRGVSCPGKELCLAVGQASYARKDGGVIRWNGRSWATMSVPRPAGATSASLASIWCTSASYCLAVGGDTVGGKSQPVAVSFNGRKWSLIAAPPIPVAGVSCTAASKCIAISFSNSVLWNGSTWTELSTPHVGQLDSISCPAAGSCLAINGAATIGWNGASWSTLAAPAAPGGITALWCGSPSRCVAVGAGGPIGSVAEQWNGKVWTGQRTGQQDSLVSVSCTTVNDCVALGNYVSTHGVTSTMSMQWNGRSWSVTNDLPEPVSDVSCTSFTFCLAVGNAALSQGEELRWNGFTWAPAGSVGTLLGNVSCTSKDFCMTIGWRGSTYSWNGATWVNQSATSQVNGDDITLSSVACASPGLCTTAGDYFLSDCVSCNQCSGCGDTFSVTEQWNGTSWAPNTSSAALSGGDISCATTTFCLDVDGNKVWTWTGGGNWKPMKGTLPKGLTSVSCASDTVCLAVGGSLVERWNGTTWKQEAAPWTGGGVAQVSCVKLRPASQWRLWCLAVGTVSNQTRSAYWYNGRWSVQATFNP
jgi:hypothetical protein